MTETTQSDGRYALIIAVSDYREPKLRKLRAPAADAERLAAVLSDPKIGGFEVDVALDEEEPQLRRRIARFFSDRRPNDLLLVHFSCHGVKDEDGELYLAARDTELGHMLGATGISSTWLRGQIDRSRSKRVVVLLDCCYSGSAPFGMRSRAGEDVNVKDHLEGRGRVVITASNATEYSYEGDQLSRDGQPSIFTEAVVEGLESGKADRDGDKWISVDELYNYVYDRVRDKTPNQNPNKLSTLEGPLHIARSVYEPPVEPAVLGEQLLALTEQPFAGARLGAVEELTMFLASSNKSVALAARVTLERMVNDDSRRVSKRASEALAGLASDEEQVRHTPPPPPTTPTFEHARELVRLTHEGEVNGVAFSPDGTRIATASDDSTARVWDSASGRELARLTHEARVACVAFSPDGTRIATGSNDRTARVWDRASGRELARWTHVSTVIGVAFSPHGTRIATASNVTAWVRDSASGRELARVTHESLVHGVAFSPDGMRIATACHDNTARVWDSASGRELARLTHEDHVADTQFSPDLNRIVTSEDTVEGVAFSPDGTRIATASGYWKESQSFGYATVWSAE